jgi:uncharacterized protein YfcZ (UPF0381/DUF406 family)
MPTMSEAAYENMKLKLEQKLAKLKQEAANPASDMTEAQAQATYDAQKADLDAKYQTAN